MKFFFFTLIIFSSSLVVQSKINRGDVVATVNNQKIYQSELEDAYKQNLLFVGTRKVTKQKVLNDLINRKLGLERAKRSNLANDPTVQKKMNDVLYHAQISKDLESKLNKIVIKDADVKRYYKNNPERRLAQILIRLKVDASEKEVKKAINDSLKIYNDIKAKPSSFPEYANKYSNSITASSGGDMGYQPAIKLPPEVKEALQGKKVGHITAPVQTQFGFHILKVLAIKDFKDIQVPFYKKIVYDTERDRILEEYFSQLRKNAKIDIKKDKL